MANGRGDVFNGGGGCLVENILEGLQQGARVEIETKFGKKISGIVYCSVPSPPVSIIHHERSNGQVDVFYVNLEHVVECRQYEKRAASKIQLEELDSNLIQERMDRNLMERKRMFESQNPNVPSDIQELFDYLSKTTPSSIQIQWANNDILIGNFGRILRPYKKLICSSSGTVSDEKVMQYHQKQLNSFWDRKSQKMGGGGGSGIGPDTQSSSVMPNGKTDSSRGAARFPRPVSQATSRDNLVFGAHSGTTDKKNASNVAVSHSKIPQSAFFRDRDKGAAPAGRTSANGDLSTSAAHREESSSGTSQSRGGHYRYGDEDGAVRHSRDRSGANDSSSPLHSSKTRARHRRNGYKGNENGAGVDGPSNSSNPANTSDVPAPSSSRAAASSERKGSSRGPSGYEKFRKPVTDYTERPRRKNYKNRNRDSHNG